MLFTYEATHLVEKGKNKTKQRMLKCQGKAGAIDPSTLSYSPVPHTIGVEISGNLVLWFKRWDSKSVDGCAQTDGWQCAPR